MSSLAALPSLAASLRRHADLVLAALVLGVVGMMIVPLPPGLLDLLLVVGITMAATLLVVALYLPSALELSSYPTLILVTTLYRLALNVASTRLILLDGYAGHVIEAFGRFVVRGNVVVGGVVFLILTIVQFLVVAKGAERVAEVGARFTLDAMPGKQMAIDADLRAGAFDLDEARRRRRELARESQLFGSMDGAMKFVKGDAIAGLVITLINIVAGVVIGATMMDLTLAEAAHKFTVLTIGDGLVSQIPALLSSMTAGLIVTRVASEDGASSLGQDISTQVLAQPKALGVTAVLLAVLGLVPGLPALPFLAVAAATGLVAAGLRKRGPRGPAPEAGGSSRAAAPGPAGRGAGARAPGVEAPRAPPLVTPVALEVGTGLAPWVDDSPHGRRFLGELVPLLREGLFHELGVRVPGVRVRASEELPPGGYIILVHEAPAASGSIPSGSILVNDTPERLRLLELTGEPAVNPASGCDCAWIPAAGAALAEQAGLSTWDPAGYLVLHLAAALRRNAAELVGLQEVQDLLEQLEPVCPALVREAVPKAVSLVQLTDVLRRLVEEGVCVRDLRAILQCLAEWGPLEPDPVALAEHARSALRRAITHRFTRGTGVLVVYLLDPLLEDVLRAGLESGPGGSTLVLAPEVTRSILDAVRAEVGPSPASGQTPVILTSADLRRYVRKLVELELPHIAVLSYPELDPDTSVQPIARIALPAEAP